METEALKAWAEAHADGEVLARRDMSLSLTSKLLRFRWNDGLAVGVGSEPSLGSVRVDSVLDGIAWFLATATPSDQQLHLVLGVPESGAATSSMKEHLDAIGTLAAALRSGPRTRIWTITPKNAPVEQKVEFTRFTTKSPQRWADMLAAAASAPVTGMAAAVVNAVDHPAFALYPKLSSLNAAEPWQMRLDGAEIGRTGASTTTLRLASRDHTAGGEPRDTWRRVIGQPERSFAQGSLQQVVDLIHRLIEQWTDPTTPAAVLRHGSPEHALEAHVLSGRLQLATSSGPLRLAVPPRSGVLGAAQFPTLWGNVERPRRYLDALLADDGGRPWAVELKDQAAGGGHGAYLRHGIGQAVLYRHYIRSVAALDPWFGNLALDRERCQAAVAFPTAATAATPSIEMHADLARRYDIEVIQFPRPGTPSDAK